MNRLALYHWQTPLSCGDGMQPAILRKFLEAFDAVTSVLIFASTTLTKTHEPDDQVPTEDLFEKYRAWKPRVPCSEAKMRAILACNGYELFDDVIVGVSYAKAPPAKVKVVNVKKPPPDLAAVRRAAWATDGSLEASGRYLGISKRRMARLVRDHREISALFPNVRVGPPTIWPRGGLQRAARRSGGP